MLLEAREAINNAMFNEYTEDAEIFNFGLIIHGIVPYGLRQPK